MDNFFILEEKRCIHLFSSLAQAEKKDRNFESVIVRFSFETKRKKVFRVRRKKMSRDIRNIIRGRCQSCSSCSAFMSVSGRVRCDYCGCPPAQHQQLDDQQQQQEEQKQEQLPQEKTVLKRSSSNDDSDLRVSSSSDDLRSCISEGEMGDDSSGIGLGIGSGGRVTGFRSNPDLLLDSPGSRKSQG